MRGVPAGDTFKRVPSPVILYEVEYETEHGSKEIAVTNAGLVLMEEDDDSSSEDDDSSSEDDD